MTWLDAVPGARAAYEYVARHLATFEAQGPALRAQLAALDAWWATIPPPPRTAAQTAVLNEWVTVRRGVVDQIGRWDDIHAVAGPIWTAVQAMNRGETPTTLPTHDPPTSGGLFPGGLSGLGAAVPWVLLVKAAAWLIALWITLRQFFAYQAAYGDTVDRWLTDAVTAGVMTPAQAIQARRAGNPGVLGSLTNLVTLGVLGAVAVLVIGSQGRNQSRGRA